MKNIVFAVGALIVIIALIFIFASKENGQGDTIIPTPIPVESGQMNIQNSQSTSSAQQKPFPVLTKEQFAGKKAVISTNYGDITFEFFNDSPIAASNYIYLASKHFYDGVIFHRVIKGFMIQGGAPTGTGIGGPGYKFEDELDPSTVSFQKGYVRGTVVMANAGPNTNGSQFFIMHQDYNLPHNYTIFGRVLSGMDVVDMIANSEVDKNDKPIQQAVMNKVTIIEQKEQP